MTTETITGPLPIPFRRHNFVLRKRWRNTDGNLCYCLRMPKRDGAQRTSQNGTVIVAPSRRESLRRIVDEAGLGPASRRLDIPLPTLKRVLNGLPVRIGTAILIEQRMRHEVGDE